MCGRCRHVLRRVVPTPQMRTRAHSCVRNLVRLQGGGRGFETLSAHSSCKPWLRAPEPDFVLGLFDSGRVVGLRLGLRPKPSKDR
jgi:hypothetical protein